MPESRLKVSTKARRGECSNGVVRRTAGRTGIFAPIALRVGSGAPDRALCRAFPPEVRRLLRFVLVRFGALHADLTRRSTDLPTYVGIRLDRCNPVSAREMPW